jgi:Domain of unknown function (DUF4157)
MSVKMELGMSGKVIQGSFLSGQPKLAASVQPRIAMSPPIQAKMAAGPPVPACAGRHGPPISAFAARPPGPPAPAFASRPPGPPTPVFAGRPEMMQRQTAGGAFAIEAGQLGLATGGGRPLPEPVRAKMEAALAADFSNVRVHVGPQAERIGAIAFTMGSDIYFAPGRYQPETARGQQLLGHELAHVVQQRAGRVRNPVGSAVAVVQDRALEAEADRLGHRATSYRRIAPPTMASGTPRRRDMVMPTIPLRHGAQPSAAPIQTMRMPLRKEVGTIQQKLLTGKKWKECAPLTPESESSFEKLLEEDNITDRFHPTDRQSLKIQYDDTVVKSKDHKKINNAATGRAFKKVHDALILEVTKFSVQPGSQYWDDLLTAALDIIVPQPGGKYVKKNATDAADQIWPTDIIPKGVPEEFWKAVLAAAKPKPVIGAPKAIPPDVQKILDDAQERFDDWVSNKEWNRGAWAGSKKHGPRPDDYESVAPSVITKIKATLPHSGWRFRENSLSADEQNSLHKYGGSAKGQDFIYHL